MSDQWEKDAEATLAVAAVAGSIGADVFGVVRRERDQLRTKLREALDLLHRLWHEADWHASEEGQCVDSGLTKECELAIGHRLVAGVGTDCGCLADYQPGSSPNRSTKSSSDTGASDGANPGGAG